MDLLSKKNFGILRLSFNRESKRNSLNVELCQTLRTQLENAQTDPDVRVVMLTSEQEVFCAGVDMEALSKTPDEVDGALQDLFDALRHFTKPIIASVQGPCVGEGLAILLFADLVYGTKEAVFAFPSTALAKTPRFGIVEWGMHCANPRLFAQKLMLSEPMNAQEALEIGLLTAALEDEHLESVTTAQATRLAVLPPKAVQATRALLKREFLSLLDKRWEQDETLYQTHAASDEATEAMKAFLEGRKPVFVREN